MMRELEHYFNLVYRTIIHHQDPVTGLLPAHQIAGCEDHAWIRDNVYSVMAVWALAMAYRWEMCCTPVHLNLNCDNSFCTSVLYYTVLL